jgi:DNA-binding response OmpR family regulator
MDKTRLLIVEDDPNLGQILSEYLHIKGFDTTLAMDGDEGLKFYNESDYDLCILDVMMPKKDGFTLAEEIRQSDKHIPIIFLTAKSMKEDKISGLKIGADDYMTKPFSMEELLLRINAVLRRVTDSSLYIKEKNKYKFGKYTFDYNTGELDNGNSKQKLTTKESELLKLLFLHKNTTVERNYALMQVWGDDSYYNARSMDVYITKLRKHFKGDDSVKIVTMHREGFKLLI